MDQLKEFSCLTGHERFREIAEECLNRFEELNSETTTLKNSISELLSKTDDIDNPPSEYYSLFFKRGQVGEERDKNAVIAIVFSAMYLEAFIYDYAAISLGDKYVKDHLDRLDLVSKWILVPRLVTGKEISKSDHAFEALKKLNSARNSLVHLKSCATPKGDSTLVEYLEKSEEDFIENTSNCRKTIEFCLRALCNIDSRNPILQLALKKT